jgi:hypothetical protein
MSFAIPINTRVSDDGLLSIVRRTKIIRNMNCSTMMIYSILVVDTMLPKYMNDYFLSLSLHRIYINLIQLLLQMLLCALSLIGQGNSERRDHKSQRRRPLILGHCCLCLAKIVLSSDTHLLSINIRSLHKSSLNSRPTIRQLLPTIILDFLPPCPNHTFRMKLGNSRSAFLG